MSTQKADIQAIQESYQNFPEKAIIELRRIAYKLQEFNLNYCNRPTTQEEKQEAEKLELRAAEIGKIYNIPIETDNDPRGYPIKILDTKKSNCFAVHAYGLGI